MSKLPEIEYICISDIHLGAYNSLLCSIGEDGSQLSTTPPITKGIFDILKLIISECNLSKKPKLILNGDIFELAIANTNEAIFGFDIFLKEMYSSKGNKIFSDKLIFIPGNHDHHLWETARETQYLDSLRKISPGDQINVPWHHTKLLNGTPLKSKFLTGIMRRHKFLNKGRAIIAYPNFVLQNINNNKYVVITHGHFIESIYRLMSSLQSLIFPDNLPTETIDTLERENFAWIDFLWSTLGRSGKVGESVGIVYDMYVNNTSLEKIVNRLVQNLISSEINHNLSLMMEPLLRVVIEKIISEISNRERSLSKELLGIEALKGLEWYISKPLKHQFITENNGSLPKKMSFLFGHTHKPFIDNRSGYSKYGYPETIEIINSGGWIIDSIESKPLHGGSIILIDEDKNCYHLNLFKEDLSFPSIEISEESENLNLHNKISNVMLKNERIFEHFINLVHKEINYRKKLISNRILRID